MKVEEIIETIRNNEEVVNEVKRIAELSHNLYDERIETYHPNLNIHGEYEFDNDSPVFRMDDEFEDLVDLIEDICDMNVGVYLHSNEWYEQEENIGEGISSPNTFAAYIAREITDDKFFQEGCLYEDTLCFYPTDDDVYHLEVDGQLDNDFEYELAESNESHVIPLDYMNERGDSKTYTYEDAASIYYNHTGGESIKSEWVYLEEDQILLRRWILEGILSLGEVTNINGCIAIHTDDKETAKRFLDDTFYSVVNNDGIIETNIPYILDKDAMTAIQYIGETTYEEDGMTCFCVENDDEINGVMVLQNYLTSIGKNITSTSNDDYTWQDIFKRKHYGTVVKTDLPWNLYYRI